MQANEGDSLNHVEIYRVSHSFSMCLPMSSTVSIWFVFAQQNYIQYKCYRVYTNMIDLLEKNNGIRSHV